MAGIIRMIGCRSFFVGRMRCSRRNYVFIYYLLALFPLRPYRPITGNVTSQSYLLAVGELALLRRPRFSSFLLGKVRKRSLFSLRASVPTSGLAAPCYFLKLPPCSRLARPALRLTSVRLSRTVPAERLRAMLLPSVISVPAFQADNGLRSVRLRPLRGLRFGR